MIFLYNYGPKGRRYDGIKFYTTTAFRWYYFFESIGFNPVYHHSISIANINETKRKDIEVDYKLDLSSFGCDKPVYGFVSHGYLSPQKQYTFELIKETIAELEQDAIFIWFTSYPMNRVLKGEIFDEDTGQFVNQNFMLNEEQGLIEVPEEFNNEESIGFALRNKNRLGETFKRALRFARVV